MRPVFDLHQDLLPFERGLFPSSTSPGQTSFDSLAESDVRVVVATAFGYGSSGTLHDRDVNDAIEEQMSAYAARLRDSPGWLPVRRDMDVDRALRGGDGIVRRGLLLHVEGLHVFGRGDWERLERWHRLGWRSLGLVWNEPGPLAGSCTGDPAEGLTPLGRELVRWCGDQRVLIDLAHASEATFDGVASALGGPLVVSHAGARALVDDPRNVSDRQLRAVADSGGLVGAFFVAHYLRRDAAASLADVADHVTHMVEVAGIEHVGIGSDLGGLMDSTVPGLDTVGGFDALWEELARRGLGADELDAIAHGNARRVYGAVLGP